MSDLLQALAILGGLLSMVLALVGVGYNLRRVTNLEKTIETHLVSTNHRADTIAQTYARKDLVDLELKSIRSRLDYMSKQIGQLLRDRLGLAEDES